MNKTLIALPLISLLAFTACGGSDAQEPAKPAANAAPAAIVLSARDVATVGAEEAPTGIRITGSLDPAEHVSVKAQTSGQLRRVAVDRGDVVRRGQQLAIVDTSMQQSQIAAARAQLAAAERDFGAAEMLFKAGAVAERDYVNARAARDAARAQVSQIGTSIAQATIDAPQNGVVTAKKVTEGEVVMPGTELFSIADTSRLELKGTVGASDVGQIRVGQKVSLALEAYPGRVIEGRIDRFDPVADASSRQVTVYVAVPNPNRELVGGLFATGLIETGTVAAATNVPPTAVRDGFVYEVSTGRVRKVAANAVASGQKVIISPSATLQEGRAVEVTQ